MLFLWGLLEAWLLALALWCAGPVLARLSGPQAALSALHKQTTLSLHPGLGSYSLIHSPSQLTAPNDKWTQQQGPFLVQTLRQVEDTVLDLVAARVEQFHGVNVAHVSAIVQDLLPVGTVGRAGLVGVSYASGPVAGFVPGNFSRQSLLLVAVDHRPVRASGSERVRIRREYAGSEDGLPYTVYANVQTELDDHRRDIFQFRMLFNLLLLLLLSRRQVALLNVDVDICTMQPYWHVLDAPDYDVADIWFQSSQNGAGIVVNDVAGCAGFMLHKPTAATFLFLWEAYNQHFYIEPCDDQVSYASVMKAAQPRFNVTEPRYPQSFTAALHLPAPSRFTTSAADLTRAATTVDTQAGPVRLTFELDLPEVRVGFMDGHKFWRVNYRVEMATRLAEKDKVLTLHSHFCESFFTKTDAEVDQIGFWDGWPDSQHFRPLPSAKA